MIRNQVKVSRTPIADPISFNVAANDTVDVYVDHIELNATTLKPSIERYPIAGSGAFQVPILQVQQDITVLLATGGELKNAHRAPMDHDAFLRAEVSIICNVQMAIGDQGLELCFSVSDLKAPELTADQINLLKQMINISRCSPLDIATLGKFNGDFELANAGIAVSSDGKRVAVRFEVGVAFQTAYQWLQFMDGEFDDLLLGRDWAIFVDGGIIANTISDELYGGFDFNKMGLQDGPFASWKPIGSGPISIPRAEATFSGWIRDACTTIIGTLDLGCKTGS
jgi:hypothetical protein